MPFQTRLHFLTNESCKRKAGKVYKLITYNTYKQVVSAVYKLLKDSPATKSMFLTTSMLASKHVE